MLRDFVWRDACGQLGDQVTLNGAEEILTHLGGGHTGRLPPLGIWRSCCRLHTSPKMSK